ncbi:hypothetical protein M407DRAFT_115587 [Tulasnella calospora MUT 4182]|uniref:C2H2-type domain-containing protein n=1 Tax=Tulasnella calospora MUT 4182 TaxID=1051891 RepID=A0A0C3QSV5_9AGAM|nr:hypothetical protein M407DRAFT_115587 [Tulasnella calospora MUT 4182]
MSSCEFCSKTLASPAGLRRHINSQHQRNEWHSCECGKRFLDPAARSRCRARHAKSFGCPARSCTYQSSRKDSVKQHIKRRHPNCVGFPIRTLPPNSGSSRQSSNDSDIGLAPNPPQEFIPESPPIFPPQQNIIISPCPFEANMYYQMPPPPSVPWGLCG